MPKDPFMLVSLNEDRARKLSRVLANPKALKILEFLAGKDATESEISKKLNIPLSTVHYNLKQLSQAKLVKCEEFHYSSRGKEVNHYTLANKYIIIAPQDEDTSFVKHIRRYVPAAVIVVCLGAVLKVLQLFTGTGMPQQSAFMATPPELAKDTARVGVQTADAVAESAGVEAMGVAAESAKAGVMRVGLEDQVATTTVSASATIEPMPWWQSQAIDYMIAGALFVLFVLLTIETLRWLWRRTSRQ